MEPVSQNPAPAPTLAPVAQIHTFTSPGGSSQPQQLQPQQPQQPQQQPQLQQPPQPEKPQRPKNPLANLLPSSGYKLRVRREREFDDPVWVGDYSADRVTAAGSVEPFLGREVAPKLAIPGAASDVTFIVCAVDPNGREVGERARISVTVPPAAVPVAPAAVPQPATPVSNEYVELLAAHRRAQEEMHSPPPPRMESAAVPSPEMDALKQMIGQLATSVQDLASRLNERDSREEERARDELRYRPPVFPEASSSPAPQLDMLSVIREVAALSKQFAPPPQPQAQPVGLGEMLNLMAQARQVFQPQQVNVDVSPLESQLQELREKMSTPKRDEIGEMAEKLEALRKVFRMVGGDSGAPQPTGLSSALGSMVMKVMENPAPLAEAVERVLSAAASARASNGASGSALRRSEPAPRPSAPPRLQLSETLSRLTQDLLAANEPASVAPAAHAWLSHMQTVPQLASLSKRLVGLLKAHKQVEFTIYLRSILGHFGFGEVPAAHVNKLVANLFEALKEPEPASAEPETSQPPDLTVRVGAVEGDPKDTLVPDGSEDSDGVDDEEEGEGEEEGDDGDVEEDANDDEEADAVADDEASAANDGVAAEAPHVAAASSEQQNAEVLDIRVGTSNEQRAKAELERTRALARMAKARAVLAQKRQAKAGAKRAQGNR